MPLTPFHLGPALLLGVLLYRRLDLPTLLIGSVVVDVRAVLVVVGLLDGPVHGILTTFVGGTAVALALTGAVCALPAPVQSVLDRGRLAETTGPYSILAAAVIGVYSHVLLDSMLYADARPLFPLDANPFLLESVGSVPVYGGCTVAGCLGIGVLVVRYWNGRTN